MRYLLVTHIAFSRQSDGSVSLDGLWAEDLKGLVSAIGAVVVAAPELPTLAGTWGTGTQNLTPQDGVTFLGLPTRRGRVDPVFALRARERLRQAVTESDIVHTSNLFPPYTALYYGHDLAVRLHKKTLFVVAEDFYDVVNWDWVRDAGSKMQLLRRRRMLQKADLEVRKRVANASLTFLHTPAAVARYREFAANAVAIRQPVHEREDVISLEALTAKCNEIRSGVRLRLMMACRMVSLKGIDFFLRAVAILKQREIPVQATLYGGGPQLDRLQLLAQSLQIAEQVEFAGAFPPGAALRQALCAGHAAIMPHLTEDFGRAFFDAMAAGLPVVAFRSIASQDTIRHRVDGLVTPNADAEGLADGIAELHYDRAFLARAAEAARARALLNTKGFWNDFRARMVRELFQPLTHPVPSTPFDSALSAAGLSGPAQLRIPHIHD